MDRNAFLSVLTLETVGSERHSPFLALAGSLIIGQTPFPKRSS